MRYYKALDDSYRSRNGGNVELQWSLPMQNPDGSWTPGEWMPEVDGDLVICKNGYHLTSAEHLLDWVNAVIYEAEPSDEQETGDDKIVCRSVRLLRRMHWDERIARLFACDCAERVLEVFENIYPDDLRPRHAVDVARRFACGQAMKKELREALAGAHAAYNTLLQAGFELSKTMSWTSEQDAALDAAQAAIQTATCSIIWEAASAAAWTGAHARRQLGSDVAEHEWQVKRLMWYLDGEKVKEEK